MIELEIDIDIFLPAYRHLLDAECDINFLWGGRDSGKSHFIAQKLLVDCMNNDYFRCILIKKTHESIKDSQWQMLKDLVIEWQLDDYFDFTSNPLEIRCSNGNKFISRGCDKHGKLRGVTNPTHAWYEEGNELSENDFITISTTLRGPARVEQWFSFNPEAVGQLQEFWLYKNYLKDVPYDQVYYWSSTQTIEGQEVEIKYSSTHVNYKVNPYVSLGRKAKLEQLADLNHYWHDVYTKGRWGKKEVKSPYAHNFNRAKHVSDKAVFNPNLPVHFSIDFNVEPFICIASHIWNDSKGQHCHVFRELVIEKNGSVPDMIDIIKNTFDIRAIATCTFTGDAMQRKREITQRNNIDAWVMIQNELRLGNRLKVPRANPSVKENRHLLNAILAFHGDFIINPDCRKLLYDLEFVEADEEGNIMKKDRNKEEQRADALDCVRYLVNTHLREFLTYRIK